MPAPILSLTDLRLVRDGQLILDNVCWEITPGQHWAILGANGSGKTSLLSALTGYKTPTGGRLDVLGQRYGASNWPELRKRIGIVSSSVRQQMADNEPALITVVSGKYAVIDYWGDISEADQAEAAAMLDRIGCRYLAGRDWRVLSQGERQRVLIARALMAQPQILILDEPCAGLDPVAREYFLEFVEALTRQPDAPTLLFVTHHVEEIIPGVTDVLALQAGRVVAAGPRSEVLQADVLGKVFGAPLRLQEIDGRTWMTITPGALVRPGNGQVC